MSFLKTTCVPSTALEFPDVVYFLPAALELNGSELCCVVPLTCGPLPAQHMREARVQIPALHCHVPELAGPAVCWSGRSSSVFSHDQ